jgi:hypothetical protein
VKWCLHRVYIISSSDVVLQVKIMPVADIVTDVYRIQHSDGPTG